jgi:hypothetical protein
MISFQSTSPEKDTYTPRVRTLPDLTSVRFPLVLSVNLIPTNPISTKQDKKRGQIKGIVGMAAPSLRSCDPVAFH